MTYSAWLGGSPKAHFEREPQGFCAGWLKWDDSRRAEALESLGEATLPAFLAALTDTSADDSVSFIVRLQSEHGEPLKLQSVGVYSDTYPFPITSPWPETLWRLAVERSRAGTVVASVSSTPSEGEQAWRFFQQRFAPLRGCLVVTSFAPETERGEPPSGWISGKIVGTTESGHVVHFWDSIDGSSTTEQNHAEVCKQRSQHLRLRAAELGFEFREEHQSVGAMELLRAQTQR